MIRFSQAGVIKRLAQMVLDVDLETRTKASQAMVVLCADANGMQVNSYLQRPMVSCL